MYLTCLFRPTIDCDSTWRSPSQGKVIKSGRVVFESIFIGFTAETNFADIESLQNLPNFVTFINTRQPSYDCLKRGLIDTLFMLCTQGCEGGGGEQ